jgi:hypothetical protein
MRYKPYTNLGIRARGAWAMPAAFAVTSALSACGSDGAPITDPGPADAASVDASEAAASAAPRAAPEGGAPDASDAGPRPSPVFVSLAERCKLISNRNLDDPSANQPEFHANLRGTDLGIPVANGNDLFFLFGDSAGYRGIWPFGTESLPDAVGYAAVPHAAVAADPSVLCTNLRFLGGPPQSGIGNTLDSRIERDFAGVAMTPPNGHSLAEYIHNPAGARGANAFPNLPGDFEVPSGAFSRDGSIYVFYTTVVSPSTVEMKGSYLARWAAPSTSGTPSYDILYAVDERFDAAGAMHGDFINVAPVVHGDFVYVYGTGEYRQSAVHLARKLLSTLAQAGGFERFDALTQQWLPAAATATAAPVVGSAGIGEISVQYFPSIQRFAMLDQEIVAGNNQVLARFATSPEGPWSSAVTVASLSDPAFVAKYCCVSLDCPGERLLNCDRAGFYGTYLLPDVAIKPDGSFTLDFMMSTWDPYNVALMSATFH